MVIRSLWRYMADLVLRPAARYPADPRAVFVLALCVFTGITSLAIGVGPRSLSEVLPQWAVVAWGGLLALGSATTLAGMTFQSFEGIWAEQVGSMMVATTTIFYSGVAFWVVGPSAFQSMAIVLGFGLACLLRWVQLQVLIHSAIKRSQKRQILEQAFAEIEAHELRELADRKARRDGLDQ